MIKQLVVVGLALAWVSALAQGGQGAGGFGGGGFGGAGGGSSQAGQGGQQNEYDRSTQRIESLIRAYLDGDEVKNILTPGEFSEWPLTLKAGQVVIAEARSDAFDPALEVVGGSKVLATNDDRYPGDQRPLLLWHCDQDGSYALRGRCFRDKAGGQFFLRYRIYNSIDVIDKPSEKEFAMHEQILIRVPMKAGQVKRILPHMGVERYLNVTTTARISPTGLPDINLGKELAPLDNPPGRTMIAPVDGDYYLLAYTYGGQNTKGILRVGVREVKPSALEGSPVSVKGQPDVPSMWTLPVKKGQLLQITATGPSAGTHLVVSERPDFAGYDLKVPAKNPFFPKAKDAAEEVQKFMWLPGRARDQRVYVFQALRDATLWVTCDGRGAREDYILDIKPAAQALTETAQGRMRIGNTDYWQFDAKVGEVMTFKSAAQGFAHEVLLRDPELNEIRRATPGTDETSSEWNLIVQKPGRHLIAVSCIGGGGMGDYTLARQVFQPKAFSKGSGAKGTIESGEVQVWTFTAMPNEPLLMHWFSSSGYSASIHDSSGAIASIPLTSVDGRNRYGILKVPAQVTYLLVLTSRGPKAEYSIDLTDLPGIRKG